MNTFTPTHLYPSSYMMLTNRNHTNNVGDVLDSIDSLPVACVRIIIYPLGTDTQELEKECFAREGMFDGVPLTNGGTIRNNYKVAPSTQRLDMTIYGNYPTSNDVPSLLQTAREKGYQIIHHQ